LLRIPAAKAAFETALQLEAEYPDALVGLGKIAANDRRPEEGMQLVNRALANRRIISMRYCFRAIFSEC
jgi:hypothetical protein